MDKYVGYTIPLSDDQVFTLLEFNSLQWVDPVQSLYKSEFILHSYSTGEIQFEAMVDNCVFIYTEAQLQSTRACLSGSFKEQNGLTLYHMTDYEVYTLQMQGEIKLFDLDDDSDIIRIGKYTKINLGGNFKYVTWVGDILVYFYESDKTEINSPYYRSL